MAAKTAKTHLCKVLYVPYIKCTCRAVKAEQLWLWVLSGGSALHSRASLLP